MTSRMLEIGVGTNPRIERKYDEYYAVDSSDDALCTTQRKLENMGLKVYRPGGYGPHRIEDCTVILGRVRVGYDEIPYPENSFDFILADQFLEHLPRHDFFKDPWDKLHPINPVIRCINDVWRVAKPDALVQFHVPKWDSAEMWQDPTHHNPVPPQFWVYFDPHDVWQLKESYGIKASLYLSETLDGGWYHIFKLIAVK